MTNFDRRNDEIYVFDDGEFIFAMETTVSLTETMVKFLESHFWKVACYYVDCSIVYLANPTI